MRPPILAPPRPAPRAPRPLACLVLLATAAPVARAQPPARAIGDTARTAGDSARTAAHPSAAPHARAGAVAATAGLIVAGAAGTQLLGTPEAWPRTWGGLGRRVADQGGFYVLQTGSQRLLARGLAWRPHDAPCAAPAGREARTLARCAFAGTFGAVDRAGRVRPNVPLLASVGAATAASLAWRPEREDAGKGWTFLATRATVVLGSYVLERGLVTWWRDRRAGAP